MNDFAVIYEEFQPKIQRYLANLVGDADAADLAQVVFLKVSGALEGFRQDSSLGTWIYKIATNTALDHARSRVMRQKDFDDAAGEELEDLPDVDSDHSDQRLIRQEMSDCIREMINRLPDDHRTVLLLSDFEELSNPEIAEVLNVSLGTVKIRLHRARVRLRQAMQAQCSFYHDERSTLMCDRK